MTWIKMTSNLRDTPEVIGISDALGMDADLVVGKLHRFWSWADANTIDGNATSVTSLWVDKYVECPGFAEVLVKFGWLSFSKKGLKIPGFEVHMSQSAKKRAVTARRVKRHRDGEGVTEALPEKRREEESKEDTEKDNDLVRSAKPKRTRKRINYSEDFDRFWTAYPRPVAKANAYKAWDKQGATEHVEAILEHVAADAVAWQHRDKDKVPHPATWLNGRRWEDPLSRPERDNGDPTLSKSEQKFKNTVANIKAAFGDGDDRQEDVSGRDGRDGGGGRSRPDDRESCRLLESPEREDEPGRVGDRG